LQPATNRFDLELQNSQAPDRPAILRWEDLHGWLAARIVERGWMAELPPEIQSQLNLALTGLYKLAGVDIVREQVLAVIGHGHQDTPELCLELDRDAVRLISLARGSSDQGSIVYPLQSDGPSIQPVTVQGTPFPGEIPVQRSQLLFRETELDWRVWVEQWPGPHRRPTQPARLPDLLGAG